MVTGDATSERLEVDGVVKATEAGGAWSIAIESFEPTRVFTLLVTTNAFDKDSRREINVKTVFIVIVHWLQNNIWKLTYE